MKLLGIEKTADGLLDILMRAERSGHTVRYFLQTYDTRKSPVGRGLVDRVADWRASVAWADLIILGSNDLPMQEIQARCLARGVPWIGGTAESAMWERDRLHGMQVFRKAGIDVPPIHEFRDYESAIAHVEQAGRPFFSKPCWDGADKALSCKTGVDADPAYMLRQFKRQHGRPKGVFILQEPIEGVEMGVGCWFGPDGFTGVWEENFEFKKLCVGDLGPNTGEMGSVLRFVSKSKLADKVLRPVEEMLHRTGFVGNIDCNTIIDDEGGVWPLEWTARCGWPSTNIEQALVDGDFVEFLAGLAEGRPPKIHRLNDVAVGVVLALPPFPGPVADYDQVVGVPVYGITPAIEERLHFAEMQAGKNAPESAGDYLLIATGTGESIVAARNQAHRVLGRLSIPSSPFWRVDIGQRLRSGLDDLARHGFAAGLRYS